MKDYTLNSISFGIFEFRAKDEITINKAYSWEKQNKRASSKKNSSRLNFNLKQKNTWLDIFTNKQQSKVAKVVSELAGFTTNKKKL